MQLTVYSVHCTGTHCQVCSLQLTLYTEVNVYTLKFTVYTVHWHIDIHCKGSSLQFTQSILKFTVCTGIQTYNIIIDTVHTVHWITDLKCKFSVYSLHCILASMHKLFIVYSPHCSLAYRGELVFTLQWTLYTGVQAYKLTFYSLKCALPVQHTMLSLQFTAYTIY